MRANALQSSGKAANCQRLQKRSLLMHAALTKSESDLFKAFLKCGRNFIEFGTGGSTILAANLVKETVLSIDSSQEWLNNVRDVCKAKSTKLIPELIYIDIGPVADWGFPSGDMQRENWPRYHSDIWAHPNSRTADLYFVDGRFRVACFLQTLLHSEDDPTILIHDFADRPKYHVVYEYAQEIAAAERLSAFRKAPGFSAEAVRARLAEYAYNPD